MIRKLVMRSAFMGLTAFLFLFCTGAMSGHVPVVGGFSPAPGTATTPNTHDCWNYQPTDMNPYPGWETAELHGLTREQLLDALGCPPHIIRMTSVVSEEYNRELWVYHPFDDDPTGLFIWLKGDVFHRSRLDEFNGFLCNEMMGEDFWK